jgi:hypothetical protein
MAGLLAILFFLLLSVAAVPVLHRAIHQDANDPNHHCAISLLTQGQIDAPAFDAPVCFTFASCDSVPLFCLSVSSAAVEFLPPARGPPPSLS